ncbi:MAG: flagella basal body P-ring formation protein FlgA [Candidatus Omnitrophica bacterium]|nr:flagella basal body P-ring formation protein FlgA [Candidatus Omnitrophota bacterium]
MIILIAVGSGLLATILVFNFLQSARVVVGRFILARTDIAKGQVIQESDIGFSKSVKRSDAKKLFFEMEDVVGQTARRDIASGDFIQRSHITRQKSEASQKKPLPIPPGMRALTVSRKDIVNVPDLLDIGSYVDIIGAKIGDTQSQEMRTIVVSRQVISVSPLDGSPIASITIAVMPDEAEVAVAAASLKPLQLLVRENRAEQRPFEASAGTIEVIRGVQKEGVLRR